VYLDGKFGYQVVYKGQHVLTIGFSPSIHGLMVGQVQLREPKGNRWLYKLSKPLLPYTLDRLAATFSCPLWLVTGDSAVKQNHSSYDAKAFVPDQVLDARMRSFYDQPLGGYRRFYGRDRASHGGGRRVYQLLQPVTEQTSHLAPANASI
jgi:hypothetical protein